MPYLIAGAIVIALATAVVILIIWLIAEHQKTKSVNTQLDAVRGNFRQYEEQVEDMIARARKDAIARSTSVVKGKVAEQLVPFNVGFGFNPRDCRFIGSPVDLVVFDGLTAGDLERVVFIEVKTGRSRLSQRERDVRDAIINNEWVFLTCRVAENGDIEWSH